ncbi:MAG TPA: TerB family tellurite resistance protein, partial [Gemmatimonadaceae bacterium]|nr:TerB family tellurite resistance protein [Gemmatimonadaceae bacterium]
MLDAIKRFVADRIVRAESGSQSPEPQAGPGAIQLAACALLLELAHADDEFSEAERAHIESALLRHFGLDPTTARELMELAEAE